MCGRYASTTTDRELRSLFDVVESGGPALGPSYNVAPTQDVRVILERAPREDPGAEPVRQLRSSVRWGLVPAWSKDPKIGSRMINARSETVTEKPSFRAAAARRRCIVPADGYYEWQKSAHGPKTPFYLHGEGVLAMARLYELWPNPDLPDDHPDKWLWTTTVLTAPAKDSLGHIHDRCPVILPDSFVDHWLDPQLTDRDDVQALVNSIPEPHLIPREVSTAVNSVRNNSPELLEPVHHAD
uniref:Abasic site processing protein n=1 Tax=Rhodococcus hoagii TaxID=43767 RepID=A0A0F7ICG7_RHOHA|nr:SOS response-associated peptidase [Prescottella equi]AKG90559.1 hypothetical protein pVAPN_1100 [Prescottella equi]